MTHRNRELDCFAPSETPARPIWAVRPSGLDTFLARMAAPQAAFLRDSGFAAEAETVVLLADPSGLAGAVLGLGEARDPVGFGGLAAALP
ncbi:MAG: leucyl aminopeptidase family protein, partial [Acetobacteraceae bacterium]